MNKIKVNELFWSAQGEGARKGCPSIFVRLTGCSLKCEYCDSKSSWEEGDLFTEDEIVSKIERLMGKYPGSQVVFTGGEPLEHKIDGVTERLINKGYFLAVETSGIYNSGIKFDWWTVSPKDVSGFIIKEGLRKKISELKLIVNKNLDINRIKIITAGLENVPVYLQPQFPDADRYIKTFELFEACIKNGIGNIRIGDQMHRQYDIR
ncbi:MAG: 7-carboxy-7-deazaguanine synthase QueE [Acidobacteriota bacterium]